MTEHRTAILAGPGETGGPPSSAGCLPVRVAERRRAEQRLQPRDFGKLAQALLLPTDADCQ